MPHHVDRPTKLCVCCGRPFQWRRKWKAVWDEVRYCSDRCRHQARRRPRPSAGGSPQASAEPAGLDRGGIRARLDRGLVSTGSHAPDQAAA